MEAINHEEGQKPLEVVKAVGELCVMYWHEKRGTLRQWIGHISEIVDDNLIDFGGDDEPR